MLFISEKDLKEFTNYIFSKNEKKNIYIYIYIFIFHKWLYISAQMLTFKSYWTQIYPGFVNSVGPAQLASELDLHCLSLSMWICVNNLDQVIWLAEN